ncbi:LysR family transcriptional regulator [Candidatus Pantoea multigeneris]|uniref:LysR family transcriptional regulator n=1 Tax=Candidatus Pantoea multigeneris TaxID=2608357 RepID=A0ABX0R4T6_9GAMM|nr:LysR family transcriptional regulator [Pantoea multigeneris]NIF20422.1 LysR family transcriptional regulator [Pantoea multigeneris]
MESMTGMTFFIHAAETRSFSAAGRILGVSSSAVGKGIARLEQRLGVRLLHRSTRSITLTAEGAMFLERCRRILQELEAAEQELLETQQNPKGRLRVSLPLVSALVMPSMTAFMARYPDIELDLDFTDTLVDVINDGFDAVIRTGELADSRLMSRQLGKFQLQLVASPAYLARHPVPLVPADLQQHACLQHKFPSTGRFEHWPLVIPEGQMAPVLPASMICNTTEVLIDVARAGLGIACLPDFMVKQAIAAGELIVVLRDYTQHQGVFRILWPSSRYQTPKLRAFIDFMSSHLFPEVPGVNN